MGLRNLLLSIFLYFSCNFVLSAASVPPPTSPIQLSAGDNITSALNLTLPSPLNVLPADPAEYDIPSSFQTLWLSHYGRQLPRADVLYCLLQATTTVICELNSGRDRAIDQDELQVSSNGVYLILHPGSDMTWGMWGTTLRGLAAFVARWEFVDLDFEARERGFTGVVGSGVLVHV